MPQTWAQTSSVVCGSLGFQRNPALSLEADRLHLVSGLKKHALVWGLCYSKLPARKGGAFMLRRHFLASQVQPRISRSVNCTNRSGYVGFASTNRFRMHSCHPPLVPGREISTCTWKTGAGRAPRAPDPAPPRHPRPPPPPGLRAAKREVCRIGVEPMYSQRWNSKARLPSNLCKVPKAHGIMANTFWVWLVLRVPPRPSRHCWPP